MRRAYQQLSIGIMALLVLSACAPGGAGTGAGTTSQEAPQVRKTITVALGAEPRGWDTVITGHIGSPTVGGIPNVPPMALDGLRQVGPGGEYINLLAAAIPDTAAGTWKVNADSTMEMTWKIVPNALWHDGTPVTSADFEFAVRARNDPEAVGGDPGGTGVGRQLTRVVPLDNLTFVAHWKAVNVTVIAGTALDPLPKHLLNDIYENRRPDLRNQRFFSTEYVGTGPFKLVAWEPGSHLEFERFDQYYRGPAKLHRVIFRIIPDANTQFANILAGEVDIIAPADGDVLAALDLQKRWEQQGSGNRVVWGTRGGIQTWELMLDPEYARPANGMTQQPVRQALLQAVNRKEMTNALTSGLAEVEYVFYHQDDDRYPFVRDLDPKTGNPRFEYPYDVRRAEQLLAQSGWTKGPDGILVHSPSGERFNYQVMTRPGDEPFRQASIVQDYWKAIGVALEIEVLTPGRLSDNEYLATRRGASLHTSAGSSFTGRRAHSSNIPGPNNRWTGNNRGHYNNPAVSELIEKMEVTIDQQQARELHRQNLILQMTDLHSYWWYSVVVPTPAVAGVGPLRQVGYVITWNVNEWDKS
ncbi:MAG: hypothetical protein HY534_07055 [Chloroflexi bacterium]|nr:hypothetical protein [Chloroflexota bacterium]